MQKDNTEGGGQCPQTDEMRGWGGMGETFESQQWSLGLSCQHCQYMWLKSANEHLCAMEKVQRDGESPYLHQGPSTQAAARLTLHSRTSLKVLQAYG